MFIAEYIKNFAELVYPKTCLSCTDVLQPRENAICTFCLYDIPETNFHTEKDNKFSRLFWGRVSIETATALFFYQKESKVQKFIYKFKYRGKHEAGIFAGKMLANNLRSSQYWNNLEIVIPVPLHPKKLRQRGYNQSEIFARGLSQNLNINLSVNNLVRKFHSTSQTRKSRFARWQNVETVYHIKNPEAFKNKNLLLVDDVVTTGSTLEACAHKLLEIEGVKIWFATLAIAT